MKKSIAMAVAALVEAGLLAGCAGAESGVEPASDTSEDAADTAPRGFEFESGFLEFGDFDPYTLGDDGFNPCTEITEQEFAAAGFEGMQYDDGNNPFGRGIPSCDFVEVPSDIAGGFYGGQIDRAIAEERDLILSGYVSELIPELYAIRSSTGIGGRCYVQIDTERGAFGARAGGPSGRVSQDRACGMAIDNAEKLFLTHGLNTEP